MKNLHIIKVKFLGPTNHKGARVKLSSERFKKNCITLPYDYVFNTMYDQAENFLSLTHNIIGMAEGVDCYYIISDTFEPIT